jgi:UDP-glucose 4-epimerase
VIAIFCGLMLADQRPTIYGTGDQERDYTYVEDVARANVLALTKGGGGMFNIGTGVSASVNRLFSDLAEIVGFSEQPIYAPPLPGEVFKIYVTNQRAHDVLGWAPTVDLNEGLKRTVESIRAKQG